ncbi:creatininase family protein [Amycolatopsis magusensis]|uniref:creatininase family protein n=1 Tax=Amycolatopsis magusensis TaxID=882444 RepID=UPI0037B941D3
MTVFTWSDRTRAELGAVLPEALVVLPFGATEQHGPHLATGTDALLATTLAHRAAERAVESSSRDLVLAPCLPFGASDHHLPFGGTLSLTTEVAIAVLTDLARSVASCGGRRLVIVNGHGGNQGVCHAAAAAASARYGLSVSVVHYWNLVADHSVAPVPGHAGEFETSLVLAVDPDLVGRPVERIALPETAALPGVDVHDQANWLRIDGYTDRPERASAERGSNWLDEVEKALADRLIALAELP